MKRHALKVGEYYAIKPNAIERDADGFFILVGDSTPDNEARGTVGVVHVRGALSQFKGEGGDSYEAIVERVALALSADPKPSSVVLCISSPGGVVAGLNECVFKLQRMSAEAKVPLVAYLNELAASAAMALACACSKRFAPPSAIAGSIGTISTMVSCAAQDKANGLDFRIITSGKRKADGHPHQPITDDAEKAERARNAEFAEQFYALASKALGVSQAKLEDLEAAIFVGDAARKTGLVDKIIKLDDALQGLDRTESKPEAVAPNTGNITDRRAKELDTTAHSGTTLQRTAQTGAKAQAGTPREGSMKPKLQALITKTEAAISTETDPAQLRILQAKLGTFLAKAEMDDDDEPPSKKKDDDDDGDDEASKAEKAAAKAEKAKKAEERAKIKSKRADAVAKHAKLMEELDDEEAKCAESEEEEARLRAGFTAARLSPGQAAALADQGDVAREALARVEKLEKSASARELRAMIEEAKAERRITPGMAKTLAGKSEEFVRDYLTTIATRPLVTTTEEALAEPDRSAAADIPAATKAIVEMDIKMQNLTGKKADEYREVSYAAHRAAQAGGLNGAAGVY